MKSDEASRAFKSPDIVVLDIMLPGIDGISVCQEIRRTSNVPIVVLTARDGERDVVVGLEVGSGDYPASSDAPSDRALGSPGRHLISLRGAGSW